MLTTSHQASRAALALVLAVALALSIVSALPADAQQTGPYTNLERVDAGSFVDAGRLVSQQVFPGKANAAILATTANFPDALSSSALAANAGAPVLFTDRNELPGGTAAELDRVLEPGATVVLMGGVEAISDRVARQIEQRGFLTERLAGRTRLETAAQAARRIGTPDGRVIIARAYGESPERDRTTGWVDSVSCGAYAARERIPVLLTETGRLSGTTANVLAEIGARRAIVCGGTAAVNDAVVDQLRGSGLTVQRVSGPNRIETSVAVARDLFGFPTAAGRHFIAVNGYDANYGYGLAATQLSAKLDAPILLVGQAEPTSCAAGASRATLCYLETAGDRTGSVTVVGSGGQVGHPVAEAAAAALGGERARPLNPPSGVTVEDPNDDGTRLVVHWTAPADPQGILAGFNVYIGTDAPARRVGGSPSAGRDARELTVTGLTPDREYQVEVTALNTAGQESARSNRASGTPTDQPPSTVSELRATAGDGQVVLTWGPNPEPDVTEYRIQRRSGGCADSLISPYTNLAVVHGRQTTTYTDATAENGTAYCYRVRAADAAGQTSPEPAQAGPVTPSAQALAVSVTSPEGAQTLRAGTSHTIRYTLTAPEPRAGITLRFEVSTDDGATYEEITTRAHGTSQTTGELLWGVPDVNSTSTSGNAHQARIRISAFSDGAAATGRSDGFTIRRQPSAVQAAAATAQSASAVRVGWDANPESTVTGYEVRRREVTGLTSQTNTESACSSPFHAWVAPYATVSGRTTTTFIDADVEPNSSNLSQQRYCYEVRAVRGDLPADSGDRAGQYSSTTSTTVAAAPAPTIALRKPEDGEIIRRNAAYTLRYRVEQPAGATLDRVRLEYCVNHSDGSALSPATCNDADGWKLIAQRPATAGDSEVVWQVPNLSQGDSVTGAVRARVYASSSQADGNPSSTSTRTGIRFR